MITYEPREHSRAIKERRLRLAAAQAHKKSKVMRTLLVTLIICFIGSGVYFVTIKQPPTITPQSKLPLPTNTQLGPLAWPVNGTAAVSTISGGVLAETTDQTPAPTASVAKVMTALMVLKKHPLKAGEKGPNVPITQQDVDSFNAYFSQDGSTVPVEVGEQISEYQALQAIMLPSANNVADTLATWSYGSLENYLKAANAYAKELGMNNTTFASDASGFSSDTVSTAHDLVLMGQAALKEPALKEIVSQQTAELPVVGTVNNVNKILGINGINGIKTGNTEAAGGCLLFSAERMIENKKVTIIGAVMKATDLSETFTSAQPLLDSAFANVKPTTVLAKGSKVATYTTPWDTQGNAATSKDLSLLTWQGAQPKLVLNTPKLSAQNAYSFNATLSASSVFDTATVPLELTPRIYAPSFAWRAQHALK